LGGVDGVNLTAQLIGNLIAIVFALASGFTIYYLLKSTVGIRLSEQEEIMEADLSIHRIEAYPEEAL